MTTHVKSTDDLEPLVGTHLGYTDYHTITQQQVNLFADATSDHQWIHVDPVRAAGGLFGGTIAHGYLTLSLVTMLLDSVIHVDGISVCVNYGVNKVRFTSPVLVGSPIRAGVTMASLKKFTGGVQVELDVVIEARDAPKPACVAQVIFRYYY